jgi:hypothetical protein
LVSIGLLALIDIICVFWVWTVTAGIVSSETPLLAGTAGEASASVNLDDQIGEILTLTIRVLT